MRNFVRFTAALIVPLYLVSCSAAEKDKAPAYETLAANTTDHPAHPATVKANKKSVKALDFSDRRDFERAEKGFIATFEDTAIAGGPAGLPAYDPGAYPFLAGDAPDTVNPSLWRQSQLLSKHGLFKVMDGIYQVRSFDLSNVTFIEGNTGWIVVDPLITKETAARAKALVDRELGARPISAVIFTHSHIDHYGGVRGLAEEMNFEVIAPKGFVLETVSENILAGNAMSRRASYMFGALLPKGPQGQVGVGLGQGISSGTPGLVYPTREVMEDFESFDVDGVEIEFMLTLGAEAPSEFMFYIPSKRAFCQAEIINHTLHNLYTPRGAKVRDGRLWSRYIDEAITEYANKTDVSFGSHHWPVWGEADVRELWVGQRDLYRYIHDQTVRLANEGHTMHEIPELIEFSDSIASQFANRGYYGTLSHNSKAQYQLYFGYFDGNPANLDPLSPTDEAKKFVEYAGGAETLLVKAQTDYDAGEFRFVATALNHLVFAQPNNKDASALLAKTYRQLAYQAESGSWRNFYLTGAQELEMGIMDLPTPRTSGPDMVKAVPLDMYFDLLAVRIDGAKAAKKELALNFVITDTEEKAHLFLSGGALHHRMGVTQEGIPTVSITRAGLDALNLQQKDVSQLRKEGAMTLKGNPLKIKAFFDLIEEPPYWFEIVRP
ncbi:MAG: alkyl/aryl-sulfatase [Maricaulaceae bacterium]